MHFTFCVGRRPNSRNMRARASKCAVRIAFPQRAFLAPRVVDQMWVRMPIPTDFADRHAHLVHVPLHHNWNCKAVTVSVLSIVGVAAHASRFHCHCFANLVFAHVSLRAVGTCRIITIGITACTHIIPRSRISELCCDICRPSVGHDSKPTIPPRRRSEARCFSSSNLCVQITSSDTRASPTPLHGDISTF
jgi:hypothetical protein